MAIITIEDLQKVDMITELEHEDLDVINGGFIPLAVGAGLIIVGSGLAGVAVGYGIGALVDRRR